MKIKIGVLLMIVVALLTACQSVVTPEQIQALEDRVAAQENSVGALSGEVASIKENMLTEDDLPSWQEATFFEDPDPRVFLGDEDVTDLMDTVWVAISNFGAVSFKAEVLDNSLSDEHGGIFYVIPSEAFMEKMDISGYDFFSVGIAQLESTFEESYREHGMVRWVRLSEGHPMGRVPALVVYSPSYGIFANNPIARGPQIDIVFAVPYDKYDTPWHLYYGLNIVGTISVFRPR